PTTTIEFDLPTDAFVTLKIYNIVGQEMGTLLNHEALDYGNQSVDFDASNLPSGVYFYRISAQSLNDDGVSTGQVFKQVKKMMLVK
ncbi:MAG TPA: T9SS type A sorting domain-containing protein, partial [Bacteroidota bacterium]|nr:T9SS type A sorting domain-containing protein [Bacteroidota bacterium]